MNIQTLMGAEKTQGYFALPPQQWKNFCRALDRPAKEIPFLKDIKFIDWKVKNILGFIGEYTTYTSTETNPLRRCHRPEKDRLPKTAVGLFL